MDNFSEHEFNRIMTMDDGLSRAPIPKWQKKVLETPNISFNASANSSKHSTCSNKTPNKRTPGKKGTPGKGIKGGRSKTPKDKGDRFIPQRNDENFNIAYHMLTQDENKDSNNSSEYQKAIKDIGPDMTNRRVVKCFSEINTVPQGYVNPLKAVYTQSREVTSSTKKGLRHIPQMAERVLDCPEIKDDFYLNLVDWGKSNLLAVALRNFVYLWNAENGSISQLLALDGNESYVGSVSWDANGNYLAVGTSAGDIELWDVEEQRRLRTMRGHSSRVGALSWNDNILTSGSRSGVLHHHDVGQQHHVIQSVNAHAQEVCGVQWSPDKRLLATGGNDNCVKIWSSVTATSPVHTFNEHQAAVKALAWCPWHPSVLATGGGTADRHIRLWNCTTGVALNSVDTRSQICSILWSTHYRELITGHGFANNQLNIWKYPAMTKVAELMGHTQRILNLTMSPDGTVVASAGADETLRLWKCFDVDTSKKAAPQKAMRGTCLSLGNRIR